MAFSLEDFQEALRDIVASRGDVTDARLARAVNLAQDRVASAPKTWWELEELNGFTLPELNTGQTAFDVVGLAIPSTDRLLSFRGLVLRTSDRAWRLKFVARNSWNPQWDLYDGEPVRYTLWRNALKVSPTPDKEFTAEALYYKLPPRLVNPGDESIFSAKDHVIVAWAAGFVLQQIGQAELSQQWFSTANRQLRDSMDSPPHVTDEMKVEEPEYYQEQIDLYRPF